VLRTNVEIYESVSVEMTVLTDKRLKVRSAARAGETTHTRIIQASRTKTTTKFGEDRLVYHMEKQDQLYHNIPH
jgi:hypothetical protein